MQQAASLTITRAAQHPGGARPCCWCCLGDPPAPCCSAVARASRVKGSSTVGLSPGGLVRKMPLAHGCLALATERSLASGALRGSSQGHSSPTGQVRRVPRASPAGSICTQRWGNIRAAEQGCQPWTASRRAPGPCAPPELDVQSGKLFLPSKLERGRRLYGS